MSRGTLLLLTLSIFAVGLAVGCGPEDEAPKKHDKLEGKVAVNLPAKPNLDPILGAPRTLPDGSNTVTGLILDRAKHLGTDVQVRGLVRYVSPDCPFLTDPKEVENRPKAGEIKRSCKSVYLTIADSPASPKEMLLIMYHPYFHPHLTPGMELIVKGKYDVQGYGFVRPRDGLVVVEDVLNLAVDADGKFYTEPEEVAKIREMQKPTVPAP